MPRIPQKPTDYNPDLQHGEKFRCCGCLNWTRELAGFGFWVPDRNHPFAIRYPICGRCKDKILRGGGIARKVANTATAYLADWAEQAKVMR